MTILTRFDLGEERNRRLEEILPGVKLKLATNDRDLIGLASQADVIFTSYAGMNPEPFYEMIQAAEKARWIHVSSAGVDNLFTPRLQERHLILTCSKGEIVGSLLAEHAMALLLTLTRDIALAVRHRHWDRSKVGRSVTELSGKTMGIIGFGGSGRALARMAQGFDMNVLALKRSPSAETIPAVEVLTGLEGFRTILTRADFVAICAPSTPQTHHLFGAEQFRQMKPSAFLINIGRGGIVDQDALVTALQKDEIAGAGLDVLETEPLPPESPLWELPNVVITPHIAGNSPYRNDRNQDTFVENFGRFVRGEPLVGQVDYAAGY